MQKAAVHHPLWGGDSGLDACAPEVPPSADGGGNDGEFRPLRRATKGSAFGNRDFFEKNRVKLLMF